MNQGIKAKIQKFLAGGSLFPCILFYIAGLIWFILLSQDELNHETYLSENALLVGQVVERFDDLDATNQYYEQTKRLTKRQDSDVTELRRWIARELDAIGLEVYTQNFTFSHGVLHPERKTEGTNLYGIMRSPSGGRTEALLLTVPLRTFVNPNELSTSGSLALVLSLLKSLRQQIYWAKDIVVVFPEFEYVGLIAWIEAYHGEKRTAHISWTEIEGRSGNIQAGLNLEFATPDVQSVDIFPEGINGLLANLDLVNTVVQIARKHGMQSIVNGQPFYFNRDDFDTRVQNLLGLVHAVWSQAPGSPTGLHGLLISYQIPALTLRGPSPYLYSPGRQNPSIRTGKFLEGILRSLNNLQERLHQSFWYYLLPNPSRYISIGVYMPPVLILIGSLLIKVIGLWMSDAASEPTSTKEAVDSKPSATSVTHVTERASEPTADEDQLVRKRIETKKPKDTNSKQQSKSEPQMDTKKRIDSPLDLLSALADIAVWTVTAFGAGLGLLVSPKLVTIMQQSSLCQAGLKFLDLDKHHLSMSDYLACSTTVLFVAAMLLLPILVTVLRRLFAVHSRAPRLWKRSIILVTWALFLSCLTCLNVSASLVLSLPVVPMLLLFVGTQARSKPISALFGFCWFLVSPLCLLLAGCLLYLTLFDEALLTVTQPITVERLQVSFQRAMMQPLMEADLFGCWTWSAFTGGFTSLWLLTWLDIVQSH